MKLKRLISVLLCFVMIIGIIPMSIEAETDPVSNENNEEIKFNLLFDFNKMTTNSVAGNETFAVMAENQNYFTTANYNGASSLKYIDRDGKGDMALFTTSQQGMTINDPYTILSKVSFVLEYDVRFEKVNGGFNTLQLVFDENSGTQVKTGLLPVSPNSLQGVDGQMYPATSHLNNTQNIGKVTRPSGVSSKLIVYPDQWYHYAFYFDSINNKVAAYRDYELIWSAPLTSFPDDMTNCKILIYSGNGNTYYDNIHLQSLNSMEIDASLDFENTTFADGTYSVAATTGILSADLHPANQLSIPYVHKTATTIETNGNNTYIVGKSEGVSLGAGNDRSFFQIKDDHTRLTRESWTISYDICMPGISDGSTDYGITNYEVSLFGLVVDGTYKHIFTVNEDGNLGLATTTNYRKSSQTLKKGVWYRLFASYDADTQKISLSLAGKSEGYVNFGTYNFAPAKDATEIFFRFGYNWTSNQYSKFYFDNIVISTKDDVNIEVDFEFGKAGKEASLSDMALGGANAIGTLNGIYNSTGATKFAYYTEESGNIYLGSTYGQSNTWLFLTDVTNKTLSKKFVMSFDFRINESTVGYTMARWNTGNNNIPLWVITKNQKLCISGGLAGGWSYEYTSPVLNTKQWYTLSVIIDPINKIAEFYIGDINASPVYVTKFDYDLTKATLSALSVGPGSGKITVDGNEVDDHLGYDNIRIYTLDEMVEEEKIPENINSAELPDNGIIVENDFENFEANTAITVDMWNDIASFGVLSANGIVVESSGNKYYQPLSALGVTTFNISSFNASPYTEGIIAIETDITFGDNSFNSGDLIIAAVNRIGFDGKTVNVPLLSTNSSGKLTIAQYIIDYTLTDETVRIRLELSYAFHTVNLYVNGKAVATAIPFNIDTTMMSAQSSFTDNFGNIYELPYTGYAYNFVYNNTGEQWRNADGSVVYVPAYYQNYGYSQCLDYIRDSIEMFATTDSADWNVAIDNLKIYLDKDADIYYNGFDSWDTGVVPNSETDIKAQTSMAMKSPYFIEKNGNRIFSTFSESASDKCAVLFVKDANKFLDGRNYVVEFEIKYNPHLENMSFKDDKGNEVEFVSIFSTLSLDHTLRLYKDGRYGIGYSLDVCGSLKDNDWSRVQLLHLEGGSEAKDTVYIYIDGIYVGDISNFKLSDTLRFGIENNIYDVELDNIRIYLADRPDAFEDIFEDTLDENILFSFDVSDKTSLESLMSNGKMGLSWNFKDFDTSFNDVDEHTVNVLLDRGDFVRVVHRQIKDTSPYNIFVNKAALEGHKQYVFETEIRYTCPTGFELEVISLFDAETQSRDRLVYILGTTRELVFNHKGYRYNLTDLNGNKLYVEDITEDASKFTKIAVIVDETANNYSIYVNGKVAYYKYNGELVTATEITIDKTPAYTPNGLVTQMVSTVSLLNMSTSTASDALLDIKSAKLYVLRTGVAPYVMATQSKIEALKHNVRFIALIDALYGTEVGFDVITNATGSKEVTRSSNVVYSSIKAIDTETGIERDFKAEEFNGSYFVVITVNGAYTIDTVEYTVRPFIVIGDSKIYNESFTVTYSDGKVVTE